MVLLSVQSAFRSLSVFLKNVVLLQSDIADVPNEMSKNDKRVKHTVKANVTPQTSSDLGQNYSSTQNNASENKKGEADQYKPRTKQHKGHSHDTCSQPIQLYGNKYDILDISAVSTQILL